MSALMTVISVPSQVPKDTEVLAALASFRSYTAATAEADSKAPNSKVILKNLTGAHPHWKLTQQRLVKILKKETDYNNANGENVSPAITNMNAITSNSSSNSNNSNMDDDDASCNSSFSSNTSTPAAKPTFSPQAMAAVDSPVDSKNILKSRLRPKSALSFVWGNARRLKTPTKMMNKPESTDEDEDADPTYVPNEDDEDFEEGATGAAAWSRPSLASPMATETVSRKQTRSFSNETYIEVEKDAVVKKEKEIKREKAGVVKKEKKEKKAAVVEKKKEAPAAPVIVNKLHEEAAGAVKEMLEEKEQTTEEGEEGEATVVEKKEIVAATAAAADAAVNKSGSFYASEREEKEHTTCFTACAIM
jgi:hypothetical protein